ncbi:MAG TPA: cytochrome c, partial [Longimicrobiales bacterium]
QHGVHLLGTVEPSIEARAGQQRIQARALATNRAGYYTATLNAPAAGNWEVTIRSGFRGSDVRLLPIAAVSGTAKPVAAWPGAERGRQLFVAKGCLTCHSHARVPDSGRIPVGPDLTQKRFPREYLQQFLADPAVKQNWSSDNRMPNLNLRPDEIAALIAFLSPAKSPNVSMQE